MRPETRRWAAVGAACLILTVSAAASPAALRHVNGFRVLRVEVAGNRFLTPEQVVEATGIMTGSTLFDDMEPWRAALLRHPLVANARFERRLPDGLYVEVTEVEPAALARTGAGLRPVDLRGRAMPIDPTRFDFDLPLLLAEPDIDEDGWITDAPTLLLLDALERVRRHEPWLATWISELENLRGGLRLGLRSPARGDVLLPEQPGPELLEQVRLAVADLAAAAPEPAGELRRLLRIDARFREQLVVTVNGGAYARRSGTDR